MVFTHGGIFEHRCTETALQLMPLEPVGLFLCLFLFRLSCLRSSTSLDDRFELLLRFFAGSEHI